MSFIYLDNHQTTKPCISSIERMQPYLKDCWALPHSLHALGERASNHLEQHYHPIYGLVHADPEDTFVFTSSSAEAVNTAIFGSYLEYTRKEGKNQFITCVVEDEPVLCSLQRLEEVFGCSVKRLSLNREGRIDPESLHKMITPKTALVSLSWAHGLTGVVQPIEEIAKICQNAGVALHVDATYALGKIHLSFKDLPISYLTFAGDRIHAPKSTGGLFVRKTATLSPLLVGGSEQLSLRASHFDMASFAALSAACQQAFLFQDQMSLETARLKVKLQEGLLPHAKILFAHEHALPNVCVASFPGICQEALLYGLSQAGVYAAIGGGSSPLLSKTLLALGYEKETAYSALHFSLSRNTTEEEIERAISLISREAGKLKLFSQREIP